MINVNLYKCKTYDEDNVKEVINNIVTSFPVLKTIKKESRVVIKANLVSAMSPDKNATTNPVLLKCLTEYLINQGCSVVIGDSPSGAFSKSNLFHIYKCTKMDETGAILNEDFSIKNVTYEDAKVLKNFEYTAYIDNADIKINFCKLKTHGMMAMSCAVKNLFGLIPGTIKPEYHFRFPNPSLFSNMLIDINEFFKFDLNIVDGVVGMDGNGPTMGDSKKVGMVAVSTNPYALDYICSLIIGLNEESVPTIKTSLERNLFSIENIKLNDNLKDYIISDFNVIKNPDSLKFYSNKKDIFSKLISTSAKKIFENRPTLIKKKCIGCGKCASICPAKAIMIDNKKAVINRQKCIKCYCCQEFCPMGAMVVKKSLVAKVLRNK